MTKRILLSLTVAAALLVGFGLPGNAYAERGHRHHGHHHHGHHHGHWHGHYRPIVYPPIYVGSYYPVQTYYGLPYYPYYGGYYPYYGYYRTGVGIHVGW